MTTLELVVVIAVLGLLVSLIVPAVQRSRAAARRTQCASRLRQVIAALHAHEAAEGEYTNRKFHQLLLPYLGVNPEATQTPIYVCPDDPESIGQWSDNRQSFVMNVGFDPDSEDGFAPRAGYPNRKPQQMRDGLSNTAAIAERLAWPRIAGKMVYWDDYPQWWIRRLRDTAVRHTDVDEFADECEYRALKPLTTWMHMTQYNHVLPPNRNSCINESLLDPLHLEAVTATSLHANGVNVAMADGSVRFVSNDIDRDVWRALGTRSGREVVDSRR